MLSQFPTIVDALEWHAAERPQHIAITFLEGEAPPISWTYEQLTRRAKAIAAVLRSMNLAGKTALLIHPPELEFVAALYGCFYAGVIAVPAYPPKFGLKSRAYERFVHLIDDARPAVGLTIKANLSKLQWWGAQMMGSRQPLWFATDSVEASAFTSSSELEIRGEMRAMLQYTSGSTRSPKGVMLSHGNLMENERVIAIQMQHSPSSFMLTWLPPYHDMGLVGGLLQPLTVGFPLLFMPSSHVLHRPLRWLHAISQWRATTSGAPDSMFRLCLRAIRPEDREGLDLRSWSVAFNGSEPVRADTIERFTDYFTPCGFRREAFFPCYGLAESTLLVTGRAFSRSETFNRSLFEADQVCSSGEGKRLVSSGKPGPGYEIAIVDPQTAEECPEETVGEIWISGGSVGAGYWNRPEETRAAFQNALPGRQGKFLRTGDLGFLRSGELFVTGRSKDLIIIGGRNFYPEDLEVCAAAAHPDLSLEGSVAFSVETDEGENLVVACELRREARQNLHPADVIQSIRRAIMDEFDVGVPAVLLLRPASVLRTTSGKLRRADCRRAFLKGRLNVAWDSSCVGVPEKPEDVSVRGKIRTVLSALLRISVHWLDDDKPLAHLGLDSLMYMELLMRLESELDTRLDPSQINQDMTLNQLEELAERTLAETTKPSESIRGAELCLGHRVPLTPSQLEFLAQRHAHPESHAIVINLRTPPNATATELERIFQKLEHQHAAFRMRFRQVDDEWLQEVGTAGTGIAFRRIDMRGIPSEKWRETGARLNQELAGGLNLSKGPLAQAAFLDRGRDETGVLFLSVHSLIADGISMTRLAFDVEQAYQNPKKFAAEKPDWSFVDWATSLEAFARSDSVLSDLCYWQAVCRFNPDQSIVQLSSTPTTAAGRLDAGQSRRFFERYPTSRDQHNFFLAAMARAWKVVSGEADCFLRLESHGRFPLSDQTPARTVGRFTCHYPFRITLAENLSITEVVDRVNSLTREVPSNGLSFGSLKYLCPDTGVRKTMHALPSPHLGVVFRGQTDDVFRRDLRFPVISASFFAPTESPPGFQLPMTLYAGVERQIAWWRFSGRAAGTSPDIAAQLESEIRRCLQNL